MVWDIRQKDTPVAKFLSAEGSSARDCWSVAFGNSYNSEERVLAAGYDNGDIKLYDLKAMKVRWSKCVKNGVNNLSVLRPVQSLCIILLLINKNDEDLKQHFFFEM